MCTDLACWVLSNVLWALEVLLLGSGLYLLLRGGHNLRLRLSLRLHLCLRLRLLLWLNFFFLIRVVLGASTFGVSSSLGLSRVDPAGSESSPSPGADSWPPPSVLAAFPSHVLCPTTVGSRALHGHGSFGFTFMLFFTMLASKLITA